MLTKTIQKLGLSSFLYSLPQFVGLLGSLVILPILTRYLSPADFGVFALMALIIGIGLSVSSLKIESGLYRYHSLYEGSEKKDFLGTLFIAKTLLGILVSLLSLSLFSFLYFLGAGFPDLPFFPFMPAAALIIFLQASSGFQLAVFVSEERPKLFTIVQVTSFFAVNFAALFFIIYSGDGVWGRFKAMIIAEVLIFFLMTSLALKKINLKFKKKHLIRSIKFSLPLYLSDLVNLIYVYTDRLVLSFFEDISKLGFLYISDKIAILIQSLFRAVEKSITPFIFNKKDSEIQKVTLENIFIIWSCLASIILLSFLILSEVFIKESLGADFQDPSVFFAVKILGIAYFTTTIYPFFSIAIGIAEETKYIIKVTSLSALANLFFNIIFIPIYGWLAAPFTTLVCCFITSICLGYLSYKKTEIKFNFTFPIIVLFMCLTIFTLSNLLLESYTLLNILIKIILCPAILVFLLLKFFKIEENVKKII